MKKGDEIELEITSLAFGGEGVGRYKVNDSSIAVFVEDTVPGDHVRVRIGTMKRKFARGYLVDFIAKAPNRIQPKCKHFGQCGGCAMQYLSYEDQLKIKEQQVKDAVKRIGGFEGEVILPIKGCESPWYYRNKMEFSFSRDDGGEGKICLGLHVRRRHHDTVQLTECFLMNDYIGRLVSGMRTFFINKDSEKKFPTDGQLLSLVVREGKNSGEVLLNLIAENWEPEFLDEWKELVIGFFEDENPSAQKLTSIYFTSILNKKGARKCVTEKLIWGEKVIHESIRMENGEKLDFEISPQAFFQPNTHQAELLYNEALKATDIHGEETVFDLFCGAGTIGIFVAHAARKVYGIEINESAVQNARINASTNNIKNIEFIAGDVAKMLPELKDKPDVIIVDPPRNGLDPNALALTAEFKAKRIVYVSCNPTTLARDLNLFTKTGYKLLSVQPVDMFPQTYHIECVAVMEL